MPEGAAETMNEPIQATYLIESPRPPDAAAEILAKAVSAGTFTAVPGETSDLFARFNAQVVTVKPLGEREHPAIPYWTAPPAPLAHYRAEVTIALPAELTGDSLVDLLAVVAGGAFESRELSAIRLLDLALPAWFMAAHPGPQFGVDGTRKLTAVWGRPVIGSIIKPNVGLTPEATAEMVRMLAEAGVDFIKDDEKMTSPPYSRIEVRAKAVLRALDEHAQRTGKRIMFAFNVTADDPDEMARRHDLVQRLGATCVMVSVVQIGLPGLAFLRKRASLPIHGHRNGWGALTRCPDLGYEFTAYQKLWRLAGIDHLHVNGIRNKYWEADESVVRSVRACLTPLRDPADRALPVVGSGMWAGQAPDTYERTGSVDMLYIAGGGIIGHPGGPGAGVRSIQQAWDAALAGKSLAEWAETHPELAQALQKFGKA
jgi:ribulose 1,5-bisphosphate carboxylase large subunit-like protein